MADNIDPTSSDNALGRWLNAVARGSDPGNDFVANDGLLHGAAYDAIVDGPDAGNENSK